MNMDPVIESKITKLFGAFSPNFDVSLLNQTCQECNQGRIICVYADLGATDFYDNYAHLCSNPNCNFVRHHESRTGSVGGRPDGEEEQCWFCQRPVQLTC
jgi:hypothetical protein